MNMKKIILNLGRSSVCSCQGADYAFKNKELNTFVAGYKGWNKF